jgi:hypothetical protein
MKSIRKQKKAHQRAARPMIKQIQSYGYKFDYKVYATYFIFNFADHDYNLHITFKQIPNMLFGIWKTGKKFEFFAEDIAHIDKFKPTRCEFVWDSLEDMMEFAGKCINDEKYYRDLILTRYEYDNWQEYLEYVERDKFRNQHNYMNRDEYYECYTKFQELIKNLDTEKFFIIWSKAECCFRLYEVWYYPTIYATKEDCHELYTKLSDCECSVQGYDRVPEDFWNKNKRDNKYHFRIVKGEEKLVKQKNYYLKTFGFDEYKKY